MNNFCLLILGCLKVANTVTLHSWYKGNCLLSIGAYLVHAQITSEKCSRQNGTTGQKLPSIEIW